MTVGLGFSLQDERKEIIQSVCDLRGLCCLLSNFRKYPVAPRTYTGASMTTEYQQKFLPPRRFSASKSKAHYHPLKGSGADMSSSRSCIAAQKWIKYPPAVTPKDPWRPTSYQYSPLHSMANQKEESISAYTYDFQPWKAEKRLPYRPMDNLKVNHGTFYAENTTVGNCSFKNCVPPADKQVFESITSYRSDYVAHPLLPRPCKETTAKQKYKNCLTWTKNPEHSDEASGLINPLKTCSLTESNSSAYLSTMRADYTAHKHHPKTQPVLPPTSTNVKSNAPFEGTTTMRDSFRAWDLPQSHRLINRKKMEWPRKSSNLNPCAKCSANTPSANLTKKTPYPVENGTVSGFKYIPTEPEETHMYWANTVDGGHAGDGPPQAHHLLNCTVSNPN
ncbi:stabilizer of axonemal microtubules 2 isoform X2 [Sphaeramia orbicularis]|uniref:stabilizer of axonemal microtubules 2 isoform X2 n=1 Tax=Sphaeramia orbicularis TaxID=375764 RepID=UPI00117DA6F7|nr:stabilizer of axonemal microtubules 1-like isoform X2 [Sphaeramia orbicularis]